MKFLLAANTLFDGPAGKVDTNSLDGIPVLIGNAVSLLSFAIGALAVIFIIVGAIQYITSAGNPDGVAKAKRTIFYAIGGVILALSINVVIATLHSVFKI